MPEYFLGNWGISMGESVFKTPANLARPFVLAFALAAGLTILLVGAILVLSIIRRQEGSPLHGETEIVAYGLAIAAGFGLPVVAALTARWSLGGLQGHLAAAAESAMWIWLAVAAIQFGIAKIEFGEQTEMLGLPAWIPVFIFAVGAVLAALLRFAHSLVPADSHPTPDKAAEID
jgi:hypothetical protein